MLGLGLGVGLSLTLHAPVAQVPQLRGQLARVWLGLALHSPFAAQPGQSLSVSLHLPSHTPQVTGQCTFM